MTSKKYTLYHYWRSSSSWRVRWALEIKKAEGGHENGFTFDCVAVNLVNGESESPEHLARNPAGFVPVLEWKDLETSRPIRLTESLAIIDYLEVTHPSETRLLPRDPVARAHVWALAEIINAGIQPIQNIPVTQFYSADPIEQKRWNQHWIRNGLETYESLCTPVAEKYSYGNTLTMADLCLMPQLYNAIRWEVPFQDLPTITRIYNQCLDAKGYEASHPDRFQ